MTINTTHRNVDELLMKISVHGPCVLSGCTIRRKANYHDVVARPRRSTIMALLATGLVELDHGVIALTQKARYRLGDGRKSYSAEYHKRLRDRGCVRKQIWVHPDDIERFEGFLRTLKGPMDD